MNVVILAAGMGKRMRSALPKVLHTLAGKPLLGHVVDTARALNPKSLTVVYGHGGDQVKAALEAPDINWALQMPQLGTGHAVQQASRYLDPQAPTLVLYGDVPLTSGSTLKRLIEAAGTHRLAILTVELDDPTGYGRIVRDPNGGIRKVVEQKDADDPTLRIREVNTGIIVAPTLALQSWLERLRNDNAQGEYYLTDIVAMAVADGIPVVAAQPDSIRETLGVNSKHQLADLERSYQLSVAESLMEQGVGLADPSRIDVRGSLICGQDVTIDVNCVFEGQVRLGSKVSIGPNCVLKDVDVGEGSRIEAFSHLEKAQLGQGCVIGPYARLRPGAELGSECHIGNFVEIKNSRFAAQSKANHLSYIGDASVGSRVNIGAGTITCNYDGANKHQTTIEDDVHIGSDTQLVAPVTIGARSDIGAGTTVWRDVPADTLVINAKSQVVRNDWTRPKKKKS